MEKLTPIAIGLACLVVLGMAAASMDGAVQTDPADVLTNDLLSLPYEDEVVGAATELRAGVEDELDEVRERAEEERDVEIDEEEHELEEQEGSPTASDSPEEDPSDAGDSHASTPTEADDPIAALLAWLRQFLLSIVPFLFLLLVAVGTVRALPRTDFLAAIRQRFPMAFTDHQRLSQKTPPSPSNPIEHHWLEMLRGLGLDTTAHSDYTTQEWAQAAVSAGANQDDVVVLTSVLEETRYANVPITDERINRARKACSRIIEQQKS